VKRSVLKGLMEEKRGKEKFSFPQGFSPVLVFKMGERLRKIMEKDELTKEEKVFIKYATAVAEFRKSIINKKDGVNSFERIRKLDSEMHKELSEQEIRHLNILLTMLSINDPNSFEELYQKLLKRKIDSS
jgi:hypothetical protein